MLQVSIIIPAYNSSKFISKAIDSILFQYYKNDIEIIFVDDGSTDSTSNVIRRYIQELSNKKYLISTIPNCHLRYYYKKNEGAAAARNFGIRKAKGEIIGFLDADDTYLQGMISSCIDELNKNDYDLVSVDNYKVYYNGNEEVNREIENYDWIEKDAEELFCTFLKIGGIGGPHKAFFRRSVFDRVGFFDTTLKVYSDLDLWIRIAMHGLKWGHIRKPLLEFNHRGSGTSLFTHCNKRNMDTRLRILKRYKKTATARCPDFYRDYGSLLWGFGRAYALQHKRYIQAFRCFSESFFNDPNLKRAFSSLLGRLSSMSPK